MIATTMTSAGNRNPMNADRGGIAARDKDFANAILPLTEISQCSSRRRPGAGRWSARSHGTS